MEQEILDISKKLFDSLSQNEAQSNLILRANSAVVIIKPSLVQLQVFCRMLSGSDEKLLIKLNKEIEPPVYAEHFYYTYLHNMELNKPIGSELKPYLEKHQLFIENYFASHHDFMRYYRSGKTELDQAYFGPDPVENILFLDEALPVEKEVQINGWSLLVARAIAFERMLCFIMDTLNMIDGKHFIEKDSLPGMEWTGSKTDLVELIYAFYAAGVLDNGKPTISEHIRYIEKLFGINLGNTSMTFQEILRRKQSTVFLDKLKSKLEMHMTRIEEKSRR